MISEKNIANAKLKANLKSAGIYAVLILAVLAILGPLYIVLVISFMDKAEAMSPAFTLWPENFNLHGYIEVFTYTAGATGALPTVVAGFLNTMYVVVPPTLVGILMSALSAFAFSIDAALDDSLFTTLSRSSIALSFDCCLVSLEPVKYSSVSSTTDETY